MASGIRNTKRHRKHSIWETKKIITITNKAQDRNTAAVMKSFPNKTVVRQAADALGETIKIFY